MKRKILLLGIIIALLVPALFYRFCCMKPDNNIEIEIGKDIKYEVDIDSYEQYHYELFKQTPVYVKGKVKSVDDRYMEIEDDFSNEILTIYYPELNAKIGDEVYVYGVIEPDMFGTSYIIETTPGIWAGDIIRSSVSFEPDDNDYMSVTAATEKAKMIYEQVLFEMEGEFKVTKTRYGIFYYLVDGTKIISLYFKNGPDDLKNEDHIRIVATASELDDKVFVRKVIKE